MGAAFSKALSVQLGVVVGTVRAAAKMGFLAISALPTIAGDSGKALGLVPYPAAKQSWGGGMRARAARGARV